MGTWDIRTERNRLESALTRGAQNFTGMYMAVGSLSTLLREHPEIARTETVSALTHVLIQTRYTAQRQAFFLYKSAADILTALLTDGSDDGMNRRIMAALREIICTRSGHVHRAVAEALGSLPVAIRGPRLAQAPVDTAPRTGWEALLRKHGISLSAPPRFTGRSLVSEIDGGERLLVVKLARADDDLVSLAGESAWADWLRTGGPSFSRRLEIPRPLRVRGRHLFQLERLPLKPQPGAALHPGRYAIGFTVHRDYFVYPNDHRPGRQFGADAFREIMCRNARLLGELAGTGIVHTAPIPLFHNRVQRARRADHGVYEWGRGGRLDQWLFSCRYPNFGLSGVRDFEHLESVNGSGRLYAHIGTHLLSLLLVAGSYFRHRDADKVGLTSSGEPTDVRHLFDRTLLRELTEGIFHNYYAGFVGEDYADEMPLHTDELVARMTDDMGVDNHMEEILRMADQEQMSDEAFRAHLTRRGMGRAEIEALKKGEAEIILHTGPHLGGFNQRISLPELIRFLETAAALCIAHRYGRERTLMQIERYGT